ncbi:MAG: lipopolysaccharide biosynthesis protein [Bacteroidales bacterium]|nr:lipopolysaccharide biosynthesis protein [Bacteroidales bacterium]
MTSGSISENSRRIARNTVLLYFRMAVMILVGLYTSRVVLNALGQDDFGTYGAVGGVVALFGVFTGSFAGAISRFMAFEMGKEKSRLEEVFSTTVFIQLALSAFVVILAEVLGIWFLNTRMVIPGGRLVAANWVLQCSIFMFVINLLSVPYNAAIIAHERMEAFAYISIAEALLALGAAITVKYSSSDRLVLYAILMLVVSLIVRVLYGAYARKHFAECRFSRSKVEKDILREMGSYAGWTFLGNGSNVLNAQGINILMNIFFGVRVNAARDVTVKLEGNLSRFINNFSTAMNPQITKAYASGNLSYMHELVCKGSKYSCLLFYFFAMPIVLEAPALLKLWLGMVPEYADVFVRISLLTSLLVASGTPFATAIFATGKVKRYQIVVSVTYVMALPATYLLYKLGFPPQNAFWMLLAASSATMLERVFMACRLIEMPLGKVMTDVVLRVLAVCAASFVIPYMITRLMEPTMLRALWVVLAAFASTALFAFLLGATSGEREFALSQIRRFFKPHRQ